MAILFRVGDFLTQDFSLVLLVNMDFHFLYAADVTGNPTTEVTRQSFKYLFQLYQYMAKMGEREDISAHTVIHLLLDKKENKVIIGSHISKYEL